MNKHIIEKNIVKARNSIQKVFAEEPVKKNMRSKMSSFGASVLMSGPLSAIAYFYKNEKKVVELIAIMYDEESPESLIKRFENTPPDTQDLIAKSISLKLALNMFIIPDEEKESAQDSDT